MLSKKAKRKEEGRAFIIEVFVFQDNHYMYWGPSSKELHEHHLLTGSRK